MCYDKTVSYTHLDVYKSQLYHQYKQLMFYVARDYFHKESAIEDAVQEAVIRIIKNFSKIGEINCPQTKHFIVIVIRSTCIDLLRTGKREGAAIPWEEVPETEEPEDRRPGVQLEEKEAYEQLLDCLLYTSLFVSTLGCNYTDTQLLCKQAHGGKSFSILQYTVQN